jgi:2-succinyl-6-hydroxy-2,4-cyclohexadiene-1-carboxylate synthase
MGGRVALALAALHPLRIVSVAVVGASAGIEEPEGRRARRLADEALANAIESEGLTRFVERWMAQPLIATQRRLGESFWAQARAQRLENRPHGLAACLRGLGLGAQPALHERLASLETPTLVVAGAEDSKFHDIAADLCARLPRARVAVIPNAGHAAHLENPGAFLETTRAFLRECDAELATGAVVAAIPSTETPRRGNP